MDLEVAGEFEEEACYCQRVCDGRAVSFSFLFILFLQFRPADSLSTSVCIFSLLRLVQFRYFLTTDLACTLSHPIRDGSS